jgi:hypothetical protein
VTHTSDPASSRGHDAANMLATWVADAGPILDRISDFEPSTPSNVRISGEEYSHI